MKRATQKKNGSLRTRFTGHNLQASCEYGTEHSGYTYQRNYFVFAKAIDSLK